MATAHRGHSGTGVSKVGRFSTALSLLLLAGWCTIWPAVVRVFQVQWPWMPSPDLYLRFRIDGLNLLFCLIITSCRFFHDWGMGFQILAHTQVRRCQSWVVFSL
jgi:NADH:ubiquinone oxidoreductase subunit 5 (subunit L)/multisubunit Na+/H+ antiporter MnhA subunit